MSRRARMMAMIFLCIVEYGSYAYYLGMMMTSKIIYTKTDEAPALATYSLLPIIQAYTNAAGVEVETRDI